MHGAWPTDGQRGLTCSKAVWQNQVGFTQDKPRIGLHLWVLLNIFLFLTWANVNLKCKCSTEVRSGSVLSLKCPYRISLLIKRYLFIFFFNLQQYWSNFRSILVPVPLPCLLGRKPFCCASVVNPLHHAPGFALPWLQPPSGVSRWALPDQNTRCRPQLLILEFGPGRGVALVSHTLHTEGRGNPPFPDAEAAPPCLGALARREGNRSPWH